MASTKPEDLDFVHELAEAGQFKSIVDGAFPMEQAAEAYRYAESGASEGLWSSRSG